MSSKRFRSSISVIMASAVLVTALPSTVLADAPVSVSIISPSSLVFDKNGDTLSVVVRYDSLPTTAGTTVTVELVDGTTVLASGSATGTDGANSTTTVPVQITGVANGTYGLQATVTNADGNLVATQSAIVVIDSVRPVADVSNPANYSRISGEVTIVGTADDENLTGWKLEAALSGESTWATYGSGTSAVTNDVLATINTATLPEGDGTYSIRLTVTDAAGNTKSSTVSAVVDNYAPSAQISSPVAGSLQKGTINIKGSASDANISSWTLETAPGGTGSWTVRKTGSGNVVGGTLLSLNTADLGDGDADLRLTVQDSAGQSKVITRSFTVDNTAPAVSIVAPVNTSNVSSTLTVTGAVSDTHLTNYVVEMKLVSATAWTQIGGGVANASGTLATLNSTTLADGQYEIRVLATDALGATNESQIAVTVDNLDPMVEITTPMDATVTSGSLVVTGSVSDGNLTNWVLETSVSGDDIWTTRGTGPSAVTNGTLATIDTVALGDGDFDIRLTATDSVGRTSEYWSTVTVDNTDPSAEILPLGSTVSGNVTVSGTANDANLKTWVLDRSPASAISWSTIGNGTTPVSPGTLGSFDSTTLPDGVYNLRLIVQDKTGRTTSAYATVTVDNVAPVSTITAPANGSLVKGSVIITGAATDGNLTAWSLKVLVGPGSWTTLSSGNASTTGDLFTLDTTQLTEGNHDLALAVTDATGTTITTTITVVVDNTAPTVTLTGPIDGDVLSGPVTFTGDVADAHLTNYVIEYALAGSGAWTTLGGGTTPATGTLLNASVSAIADGEYNLRLTATDALGHSSSTPTITAWIDNIAPTATIATPVTGTKVKGSVIVSGTADDANLQDWGLEISADAGATWSPVNDDIAPVVGGTLGTINTALLTDGNYLLRLTVYDVNGSSEALATIMVDNTAPTVTLTGPIAGDRLSGPVTFTGDVADANLTNYVIEYALTGSGAWTTLGGGTSPATGTLLKANVSAIADGEYDLRLTATDALGHSKSTPTITAWIDNIAPTATIATPVTGTKVKGSVIVSGTADDANLQGWGLAISADAGATWSPVDDDIAPVVGGTLGTIDTTLLTDGNYQLRLTVSDVNGSSEALATIMVDNTAPTVTLTWPTAGDVLSGPVTFTGDVADANLTNYVIEYALAGSGAWTTLGGGTSPATGTLLKANVSAIADSKYDLRLTATDALGHSNSTPTITAWIDNHVATATIATPVSGTKVKGIVTVTGTANDLNLQNWGLEISADAGVTWSPVDGGTVPVMGGTLGTINTAGLSEGNYQVRLTVYDVNGSSEALTTITVDNTLPTATLTSPLPGVAVRGLVTILGTVDDTNFDSYTVAIKPTGAITWVTFGGGSAKATVPSTLATLDTTGRADGPYDLKLTVVDALGNSNTATVTGLVVDNTAPIAGILAPVAGAVVTGNTVAVSGTADDLHLTSWILERSPASAGTWTTVSNGTTQVTAGPLGTIDASGLADGTYDLRLTVTDAAGWSTIQPSTFTLDNLNPTVTVTVPATGTSVRGSVAISGSVADANLGSYVVQVSPTGLNLWTTVLTSTSGVTAGTLATWDTTTNVTDGIYDVRVTATDKASHTAFSTITVTVDNTAPTAAITGPADGAVTTGTITVTGTAIDAGIASWTLEMSDAGANGWSPVANGTASVNGDLTTIDTTLLADRTYALRLTVTDTAGWSTIDSSTLTVDNLNPTLTVTAPATGTSVRGSVAISGSVADANLGSYVVEVSPAGQNLWTILGTGTSAVTAGTLATWDTTTNVADGLYDIRSTVTDKASHTAFSTITLTVDNTAPTAAITGPASGAVTTGTITVTGTAMDAGIASWTLEISDAGADSWSTVDGDIASVDNGDLTTIDTTSLGEGDYDLRLTVQDLAGKSTTATSSFKVDLTAPTVSISAPTDGAKLHGAVSITGTVADANLTGYVVAVSAAGGNTWTTIGTGAVGVAAGELASLDTMTLLPQGSYDVRVTATDATGAVNSATVTVAVENTAPTATIADPVTSEVYRGSVPVTGTANDANLTYWLLRIAPAGTTTWSPVNSGTTAVDDDTLGTVVTTGLADGDYTLSLVVNDQYGNSTSTTTTITVDNTVATAAITFPAVNGTVDGAVKVKGSVADAHLKTWTLGYAAGSDNVGPYTEIANGTTAVTANTLGSWNTGALADGNYTLALIVTDKAGNTTTVTRNVLRKKASSGGGGGGVVVIPTPDTTAPVLGAVTATIPEWITKGGEAVIKVHGSMTDANPDHLTLVLRGADGVAVLEVKADGKEGDLSLTIPASVADGLYSVVILGVDKAGNTTEQTVQSVGIQRSALVAPKLASIPALTNKAIALDWTSSPGSSSVGIKRYTILRSVNGGEFVRVGETTGKTFSESVLTPGTVSYKVVLESKSGLTTAVTTDSIEVRTAIPAPVLKSMSGLTTQKLINVGWSSVGVSGAEYDLYRTGPNGQVLVAANLTVTAFTDLVPGAALYTYTVEAKDAVGNKAQSAGEQVAVAADVPVAETTANQAPVYVTVAGRFITGDAPAFVRDSRTYAPVRFVAEAFGATVSFDQATQTVKIVGKDGRVITAVVGSKVLTVTKPDGSVSTIEMDVTAFIENGRTYIPVRFVAEALGLKVSFDEVNRIVLIAE